MDKEKYVDESWKEQASEEKEKLTDTPVQQADSAAVESQPEAASQASAQPETAEGGSEKAQEIEVNFLNYVTSLGFQAMIFMGEIPNPMTNEVEKNLTQAKFLIDTLAMLKEKTAGNLNDQESSLLESSIYELQMRYVQIFQKETSPEEKKAE